MFDTASFYYSMRMTQTLNAITHTVYSAARGGTVYIYYYRSFYDAEPVRHRHKIPALPLKTAILARMQAWINLRH